MQLEEGVAQNTNTVICYRGEQKKKNLSSASHIPVTVKHLRFNPPFQRCKERSMHVRMQAMHR